MDCESRLQLQQQYKITEFGRSAEFPRIPWNSAETWKFRGNGQIPRLGLKFRGPRKTVVPTNNTVPIQGNIIRTASCWVVWHNVHSQQHTYVSSSYRSSRLGLSHWDPYAMRRGGCLELYYCSMVEWSWWDSSLIWRPTGFLQGFDTVGLVIWPVKIVPEMTNNVSSGTLSLYITLLKVEFTFITVRHSSAELL